MSPDSTTTQQMTETLKLWEKAHVCRYTEEATGKYFLLTLPRHTFLAHEK